jgi:uncharacterized protein (DUF1778 family)
VSTKAKTRPSPSSGSTRVNLRVDRQIKQLLLRAARLERLNLTEFMIRSSQTAAEMALADRARFTLSPEKWRQFNAALDAPPRDIPALRQLFAAPPIFSRT